MNRSAHQRLTWKKQPFPVALRALLLVALLVLLQANAVHAQLPTRQTMPQGVVLVVKIVDDSRLAPTTGVVASQNQNGESLVIVPADFASVGDEIIVLDGGTDIFENGRDARLTNKSDESGLAILAVEGLRHQPVRVTFNPPATPHELRLAAFPAADVMAGGAPPYWIPLQISGAGEDGSQSLLPGATAPNLTGPLIDLCGQWAGMVIATGTPGVNSDDRPRIIFNDSLLNTRDVLDPDLNLELASCTQVATTDPTAVASTPRPEAPQATAGQAATPADAAPGMLGELMGSSNLGKGALVFLGSALVSGLVFWIIVRQRSRSQRSRRIRQAQDSETVTFSATGLPTRATQVEQEAPFVPGTKPPGSSGWIRIEGSHADGRPLRAVTAINEGRFKVTIGRAGVELAADGPGISRQHAVIQGENGRMTITDLGSRNGTFVNGVRCQRDEIFVLNDGDDVLLGAAPVKVRLSPARGPIS